MTNNRIPNLHMRLETAVTKYDAWINQVSIGLIDMRNNPDKIPAFQWEVKAI